MQTARVVQTKISYVRKGSKSLKVIIPEGIADTLKLIHGDALEWEIEIKDNQVVAYVKKA